MGSCLRRHRPASPSQTWFYYDQYYDEIAPVGQVQLATAPGPEIEATDEELLAAVEEVMPPVPLLETEPTDEELVALVREAEADLPRARTKADPESSGDEMATDPFSEAESLLPPTAYSETRPSATRLSSTDSSTLRYQVFSPGVQRRTPWSSLRSHVSE